MDASIERDRGQAVVLVLALVAVLVVMLVAVAQFGARLVAREQAQVVADAAALAGVVGGQGEAERMAIANGGVLMSFQSVGDEVVVEVEVEGETATARATRAP